MERKDPWVILVHKDHLELPAVKAPGDLRGQKEDLDQSDLRVDQEYQEE
jgi:hypothetical protein